MEVKVFKGSETFQEVWSWLDEADSFCGLTRIARRGRPAAHFYSRPRLPYVAGVVEISPVIHSTTASPALAGLE